MQAEIKYQMMVSGKVTRLYPSTGTYFFHLQGDASPYGFTKSDYNFIIPDTEGGKQMATLLLEAAKRGWVVTARRSEEDSSKHLRGENYVHYHCDYIYVDFKW